MYSVLETVPGVLLQEVIVVDDAEKGGCYVKIVLQQTKHNNLSAVTKPKLRVSNRQLSNYSKFNN